MIKRIFLLAAFVAFNAQADVITVQSSGTGDTCNQALTAAKKSALEKVNGTFLHSVEKDNNGRYSATLDEYSGGVIKSFKYLRDDCTFVIIEAQVERRSNIVQFSGADLKRDQVIHIQGVKEERDRKQSAVKLIDNRRDAVYFDTDKITMSVDDSSEYVDVAIAGKFALKDKWKSDYKDIREMFGWFNLPSFAEDAYVLVTAYNEDGKPVFTRKVYRDMVYGGEWRIWYIKKWGVDRVVDIRLHETDPLTVKIRVPLNELQKVKTFKVEVV
jgi:hypothetical protein